MRIISEKLIFFVRFVPWDLEYWDASGATFSYLDETLFLRVKFGSFVDNHLALHKKPVKEIVDFDITSHFKGIVVYSSSFLEPPSLTTATTMGSN